MSEQPERASVVVIGGGPAGLSAALTIARSAVDVRVLDANRPRHSATLVSHGFLTRDGIAPSELRRLGREEVDAYPNASVAFAAVTSVTDVEGGLRVRADGVRGEPDQDIIAERVLIATGLRETLPRVPSLRAYYGTALHSCFSCDAWEKRDQDLALIGVDEAIVERALLIASVATSLTLFPHDATLSDDQRASLAAAGVRVVDGPITALEGDRTGLTGIRVGDDLYELTAGFVVPRFDADQGWLSELDLARDASGTIHVDAGGRTSHARVYAAGESTTAGPSQLIVAAGEGARCAVSLVRDRVRDRAAAAGIVVSATRPE